MKVAALAGDESYKPDVSNESYKLKLLEDIF
jgi:hypothetical protein